MCFDANQGPFRFSLSALALTLKRLCSGCLPRSKTIPTLEEMPTAIIASYARIMWTALLLRMRGAFCTHEQDLSLTSIIVLLTSSRTFITNALPTWKQ